jgi:hypothetical protein
MKFTQICTFKLTTHEIWKMFIIISGACQGFNLEAVLENTERKHLILEKRHQNDIFN